MIAFFGQSLFNPKHPSAENKGIHEKSEGIGVVEIQRAWRMFLYEDKRTDTHHI